MKKNPQNEENLKEKEQVQEQSKNKNENGKKGFFKKIWYSIDKIEKYPELSAEGFKSAIKYLAILIVILAFASAGSTVYRTSLNIKKIAKYIDEKIPEITYSDSTLKVNSEEIIIDENESFGKIIIDTNTDDEQQINQYVNDVSNEENAVIVLKNKLMLKEVGTGKTTDYNYKELLGEMGVTEFNKQELVEYLTGKNMINLYLNLLLTFFIYSYAIYFINTLFYVVLISLFGFFVTMILRLKVRYVAVLNMAIYAMTLSTILNFVYIVINAFYQYRIAYFDVMYVLVALIYVIAAVFILKSEFNKKQGEVQKIVEVEKMIREDSEKQDDENKNNENKDTKKEEKPDNKTEDEKEDKTEDGDEPEGSNA